MQIHNNPYFKGQYFLGIKGMNVILLWKKTYRDTKASGPEANSLSFQG